MYMSAVKAFIFLNDMMCLPCRKRKKYDIKSAEEHIVSDTKQCIVTYSKQDEQLSFTKKAADRLEDKGVPSGRRKGMINDSKGTSQKEGIGTSQKEGIGTSQKEGIGTSQKEGSQHDKLQRENDENPTEMKLENERLGKENKAVENGSAFTTSAMSKLIDLKGNFENINDEVNNTRLAQRFESLYSQKWVLLIKRMVKNCKAMPEVDRISLLTNLIKIGYEDCKALAERKLSDMIGIGNIKDVPTNEDVLNAKQKRKQEGIEGSVKQKIVQDITEKLLHTEDVCTLCSGDNSANAKSNLQTFLEEYIDCCWLMSVSIPTMVLEFNVVGKLYSDCSEHFKVYSSKRPVEDLTKDEGEIYEVVWPCVQLEDESAIYMKGDVIVVKKGKQAK